MSNNAFIVYDIVKMFETTFGRKPYVVGGIKEGAADKNGFNVSGIQETTDKNDYKLSSGATNAEKEFTAKGSLVKEQYNGVEIMLPVRFYDGPNLIAYMPYVVLSISGGKTIIRTPLAERMGSVKEQYNEEDYKINIKGFLISADRKFPEAEIDTLRILKETKKAVTIDNALTNIFLTNQTLPPDEQRRVVVTGFELPDVTGGREHVRPFTMSLESDTVFKLELK